MSMFSLFRKPDVTKAVRSQHRPDPAIYRASALRLFRFMVPWVVLPGSLIMVWMMWTAFSFDGLHTVKGLEMAQAARHLARGDGFVTSVLRPLTLRADPSTLGHPDWMDPPLPVILEAGVFLLGGATDRMAALMSGLGWMVCGVLIYWMARRFSGQRRVGVFALFFWLVNLNALQFSTTGSGVTWASVWVTGLFWCLAHAAVISRTALEQDWSRVEAYEQLPWEWAALSGLLAGLIILSEPALALVVLLPLLIFWGNWPKRAHLPPWDDRSSIKKTPNPFRVVYFSFGFRLLAGWLIPVLLLGLPLLVRYVQGMQQGMGAPAADYAALTYSAEYPGESVYRLAAEWPQHPVAFIVLHALRILRSSVKALFPLVNIWLQLVGLVPMLFFILSLFCSAGENERTLRRILLGMVLISLVIFSLASRDAANYLVFVPVITVLAAVGGHRLIADYFSAGETAPRKRKDEQPSGWMMRSVLWLFRKELLYGIIALLAMLPLINLRLMVSPRRDMKIPPGVNYLKEHGRAGDVVLTDTPWIVAWYGDRPALWLPQRIRDLDWLREQGVKINWVYIVGAPMNDPFEFGDWWNDLITNSSGWRTFMPVMEITHPERLLQNGGP